MTGPGEAGDGGQAAAEAAAEAAVWVVRLAAEDAGEADWTAFAAWLEGAPADRPELRREAFDRAQAMWLELDGLRAAATAVRPGRRGVSRQASLGRRRVAAAAAAACVVAAGGWLATALRTPPPRLAPAGVAYATAPGERRTLRLADGTRIEMDGATRLAVQAGGGQRRVALARGEAAFDVRHDPSRPFVVDLGGAEVRVLGTAFDVVREPGETQVGVERGAVSFSAGGQSVRLPAGRVARLGPDGTVRVIPIASTDVAAWSRGLRLYRDRPLSEVVADLNRRYPQPIQLGDAEAGRLRFTGVLVLGPRDEVVRRLTALLPLDRSLGPGGSVVLSSRRP